MTDWTPDPQRAHRDAMTHTQRPGAAPYYLRCEHFRGDEQCKLAAGHPGEHQELKEKSQ